MKKTVLLLTLCVFTGCASFQSTGQKISVWWAKPETKLKVEKAEQIAFALAINIGLATLQQYGNTGKVNVQSAAIVAGANTLYQQASALRQLQGTVQAIDPVAIAQVLEQNGSASDTARQVALVIANSGNALVQSGIAASRASELQASEFDRAAGIIMQGATP